MLRFISFGSGSSGNCYLLFTDSDALLVDVGVGIRQLKKRMRDYGLSLSQVHHILVTHDHADHIKSVGVAANELSLPVYTTDAVHHGIDGNYSVRKKIAASLRHRITPGETFALGEFQVTAFHVPHDSSDNVGYRIEACGVTFVIMTDAGWVTPEMEQNIELADFLVIEANHDEEMLTAGPYPLHLKERILSKTGHLSNKSCGEALAQHATPRLNHVWLCHLSEENNHPELARKTVESILRSYGIVAGKDFELDILKRNSPMGIYDLVKKQ